MTTANGRQPFPEGVELNYFEYIQSFPTVTDLARNIPNCNRLSTKIGEVKETTFTTGKRMSANLNRHSFSKPAKPCKYALHVEQTQINKKKQIFEVRGAEPLLTKSSAN